MARWVISVQTFFFQAEDGIRDKLVTGVQTCALPISAFRRSSVLAWALRPTGPAATEASAPRVNLPPTIESTPRLVRSEERRVGKECRSGGAPQHQKNKIVLRLALNAMQAATVL